MSVGPVANLLGSLPSPFGGFAPFPNSIMVPFMGFQSAVLGYEFGVNYELGKRTVKSLPNDLFNEIRAGSTNIITVNYDGQDFEIKTKDYLSFLSGKHYTQTIQQFYKALPEAMSTMDNIIDKSVEIELKKAQRTPSAMAEILQTLLAASAGELVTKLDSLDDVSRNILFQLFPLLGVLYQNASGTTSPEEPTEEPTTEEPTYEDPSTYTAFTVTYNLNETVKTFESGSLTLSGHKDRMQQLRLNWGQNLENNLGDLGYDLFMPQYYDWIWQTYGDGPTTFQPL